MDKVLVQEQVHTLLTDQYVSIKINLDQERSLARKYRVGGIPALLFFDRQGNLQERINGYVPMDNLVTTLKKIG